MEPTPVAPTERGRRWAATMAGPREPGAAHGPCRLRRPRSAPAAPVAALGPPRPRGAPRTWSSRPGATRAGGAGRRAGPEEPDPWRTCFERDRDRILHSSAFRRLAGKTQVFIFPADHQRTRLTHALEVAQVATGIARACRLNVALTEAIALGHDCGHGPGGPRERGRPRDLPPDGVRPRRVGRRRVAGRPEPVRRDPRRHPQPLLVASRPGDTRRRGGELGRPHRLRVPRLGGRRLGRHRDPGACCPTSCVRLCGETRSQPAADASSRAMVRGHLVDGPGGDGRGARRRPGRLPAGQLRAHLPPPRLGDPGRRRSWPCCAPWSSTSPTSPTASPACAGGGGLAGGSDRGRASRRWPTWRG